MRHTFAHIFVKTAGDLWGFNPSLSQGLKKNWEPRETVDGLQGRFWDSLTAGVPASSILAEIDRISGHLSPEDATTVREALRLAEDEYDEAIKNDPRMRKPPSIVMPDPYKRA